jgi:GAF domain-containing protein
VFGVPRGELCTRARDIVDVEMSVDRDGARVAEIEATLVELRSQTGASRVTLRQNLPGEYAFPVTHESLAPGAGSLREERTIDLRSQPVAQEVGGGRQVVQDDCALASVDPAFHRMREVYGGLAAQIVTPVVLDGRVIAIVSVHQLGLQRHWSQSEIEACAETAERLAELL